MSKIRYVNIIHCVLITLNKLFSIKIKKCFFFILSEVKEKLINKTYKFVKENLKKKKKKNNFFLRNATL